MRATSRAEKHLDRRYWESEIKTGPEEVKESQKKQEKPLPAIEIGLAAHIAELKKLAFPMDAHER